jgi:hypothetical protein
MVMCPQKRVQQSCSFPAAPFWSVAGLSFFLPAHTLPPAESAVPHLREIACSVLPGMKSTPGSMLIARTPATLLNDMDNLLNVTAMAHGAPVDEAFRVANHGPLPCYD